MSTVRVEHVARIEGHGTISLDVENGEVREIRMDVIEPARFFESMIVGRRYDEVPLITSRICGICSPNHAITSIKSIEAALGIEVSERTRLLRQLLVYGSFLQNHATHLYLLAAPDYVGLPSIFPLAATQPDVVQRALRLKKLGNDLTTLIGGRQVHPITATLGGFTAEPSKHDLETIAERLREAGRDAADTIELVASFDVPTFASSGEMLALVADDTYAIYDGEVGALDAGWRKPISSYREFIDEAALSHSNAKHATVDGRPFIVGALARVNLSWRHLTSAAQTVAVKSGFKHMSRNTFHNNLCQAIELLDAAQRCAHLCEALIEDTGSSLPVAFDVRAGCGHAATEAPRGTLYHTIAIDKNGLAESGNVITPTAQNLANLEADMRAFAPTIAHMPEPEFLLRIEQLVRAYDPCMSCAVH